MGLQIDIVGLDALTATLHKVSDTSDHEHPLSAGDDLAPGTWACTVDAALGAETVGR